MNDGGCSDGEDVVVVDGGEVRRKIILFAHIPDREASVGLGFVGREERRGRRGETDVVTLLFWVVLTDDRRR
jgi:hypothetical protein